MTREEAIENIKLIRFNAALTNANSFRKALDMAIEALSQPSLPFDLDEAAEEYIKFEPRYDIQQELEEGEDPTEIDCFTIDAAIDAFKAGAEWMAGQGWHDAGETPSIFGVYLLIHENGWCVANYMGKGVVNESGWVEAIHHIGIEHPQKWLDLRDLIPKKQ